MKKTYLLLCLLACLNLSLITTGCNTPEGRKYKATATLVTTVETGMKVYNEFVAAGKITVEQEKTVRDYYQKYQAAIRNLRRVIIAGMNQPEQSQELANTLEILADTRNNLFLEIQKQTRR